jgi:twitching motility protein PilU
MALSQRFREYLQKMVAEEASDLYLTVGLAAQIRLSDGLLSMGEPLTDEAIHALIREMLNPEQLAEYTEKLEYNCSLTTPEKGRFRVNVFTQQQHPGMVIRRINTVIPSAEEIGLPAVFTSLIMRHRGLILVVGATGSGKSTSLAAMLDHRNRHSSGHIITIEDPIEFVHEHKGCIITQREIGIDTHSYHDALKNALRQRPDVVLIGEIRERETMEHAIHFTESGHLCVATIHARNASQAIERIIHLFPHEEHPPLLYNLSLNLAGVISQRLVPNLRGGRSLVVESMQNEGIITRLIEEGRVREIKDAMEKNRDMGMQTFDHALVELVMKGEISEDVALSQSDSEGNMRLQLNQWKAGGSMPSAAAMPTSYAMPTAPSDDAPQSKHLSAW